MSEYLYRDGLDIKTTSTYANFLFDKVGRTYTEKVDGSLRLPLDDECAEILVSDNFIYDVGGILLHKQTGESYDLGKYARYQCEVCLVFVKKAFKVDNQILCAKCHTPTKDAALLENKPTITIQLPNQALSPVSFTDSLPRLLSAHIYILKAENTDAADALIAQNQFFSDFGMPNKPILVIPRSSALAALPPPPKPHNKVYVFDNYIYADEPKPIHYHLKTIKRSKIHINTVCTNPKNPTVSSCHYMVDNIVESPSVKFKNPTLKSPAWAMLRFIVRYIIQQNWREVMMYKIYDCYGIPQSVFVDHRISTKMLQSAVSTLDDRNLDRSAWHYEVFLLYKAICKGRYGGDAELTLEDAILGLSGRGIGTVTGDVVFHYSPIEQTLFFESIQTGERADLLEWGATVDRIPPQPDVKRFSFEYSKFSGMYKQVGDFVSQRIMSENETWFDFKSGRRSGLCVLYSFYGLKEYGRVLGGENAGGSFASSEVYLDGGCISYSETSTLPIVFRVYLKTGKGLKKELSVVISYWKLIK